MITVSTIPENKNPVKTEGTEITIKRDNELFISKIHHHVCFLVIFHYLIYTKQINC